MSNFIHLFGDYGTSIIILVTVTILAIGAIAGIVEAISKLIVKYKP